MDTNSSNDNFPIKGLVIHCSDSGDKRDFSAADVRSWHIDGNGWSDIAYHYIVRRSGEIEPGRKPGTIGAHVYGHNRGTLGLCWIGTNNPTPEQYLTLIHLAACLAKKYGLTEKEVKGHYEYNAHKTCPNLDMNQVRKDVAWRLKEMHGTCERTGAVCACSQK